MSSNDLEHLIGGITVIASAVIATGFAAAYLAWVITGRRK